jgi:hypothetical protein
MAKYWADQGRGLDALTATKANFVKSARSMRRVLLGGQKGAVAVELGLQRARVAEDRRYTRQAWRAVLPVRENVASEAKLFAALRDQWRREVGLSSSGSDLLTQSFLQIIALGQSVLPLILRELQTDPDYWFPALEAITRENPVDERDVGDLEAMTRAWLEWARRKGHLT